MSSPRSKYTARAVYKVPISCISKHSVISYIIKKQYISQNSNRYGSVTEKADMGIGVFYGLFTCSYCELLSKMLHGW